MSTRRVCIHDIGCVYMTLAVVIQPQEASNALSSSEFAFVEGCLW